MHIRLVSPPSIFDFCLEVRGGEVCPTLEVAGSNPGEANFFYYLILILIFFFLLISQDINSQSRVIHLGSGLGGPARYLAGKVNYKYEKIK